MIVEFKVNIVMPDYGRARLDAINFLDEVLTTLVKEKKIQDYSLVLLDNTPILVGLGEDSNYG